MKKSLFILGVLFIMAACTPKVTEPVTQTETKETPDIAAEEDEDLSPCPKFSDAPNPDEAETNYVLYRDFLRAKDWDQAFELWQKVYAVAPAADGKRNTVYSDGIRFYEYFISQTQDSAQKEKYINEIFTIYDRIDECYDLGGNILGRKAFDLYYKYPDRVSREEVYSMFKAAIDADGLKSPDFIINPFTSLLVELCFEDKVPQAEAQKYAQMIRDIIAKGLSDCKGKACERWEVVESYAPIQLERFETIQGFYDCTYYTDKYYPDFEAAQDDCEVVRTVYSRMKWGGCTSDDAKFAELIRVGNENCAPEPGPGQKGYQYLQDAEYDLAIEAFQKAANESEEVDKKARYTLIIAKIYYSHKKNYPQARKYALQAAEIKSNWGDPYMLIGTLYASSGPLCGPGRGWDSQIVTWPAIDMWSKAKSIDPSVASEANKLIGRYKKYMPSREDIFQRTLKEGDSFRVGCWIQTTTTIRAASN